MFSFYSFFNVLKNLNWKSGLLSDPKVTCDSSGLVLFWFFLHFGFGWGEGQVTHRIFFIVGIFSNYQLKICTEIQLVCLLHS